MAQSPSRLAVLLALVTSAPGCARPAEQGVPPGAVPSSIHTAAELDAAVRALLQAGEPLAREEDWMALGEGARGVLGRLAVAPGEPLQTRTRAVAALALFPHPETGRLLRGLLAETGASGPLRSAAALALGRLEGRSAVPVLRPLLQDPSREVREAAARALGSLGGEEARGALEAALGSEGDGALREVLQRQLTRTQL